MPKDNQRKIGHHNLVGIIPAAGTASRLGPLPCSKELLPVGFHIDGNGEPSQPKAVGHYLLERMQTAGVPIAYIILRKGKWDIPGYFGDGKMLNLNIAYLLMDLPFGVPFTIDEAHPFIKESMVVFGFPDIIFEPEDAFLDLITRQEESKADIVLGLFGAKHPHREDMVRVDRNGCIEEIEIKPLITKLRYTWLIAVWGTSFTELMHQFVSDKAKLYLNQNSPKKLPELFMSDVITEAIRCNFKVISMIFQKGRYLDMGALENLRKAYPFIY
jgi:glucose-1-phosphate thymidylyltransferase